MEREQEQIILRCVQNGDTEAFEALVKEYEKNVYNVALRLVTDPEDAADMTQEAFLRAFNSASSFRGDCSFASWMFRITTNVCLDFLRSRKNRSTVPLYTENEDGEETELDIADDSFSPEILFERKSIRDAVHRGLDSLPPDQRAVLLLREIQGLSYEEIGKALELEAGTVKSRIFRARKKLCAFLKRDGNIETPSASCISGGGVSDE